MTMGTRMRCALISLVVVSAVRTSIDIIRRMYQEAPRHGRWWSTNRTQLLGTHLRYYVQGFCPHTVTDGWRVEGGSPEFFRDILLVILYHNTHYDTIPWLQTLYRPYFPNIVYCGLDSPDLARFSENWDSMFIAMPARAEAIKGEFRDVECSVEAMRRYPAMAGYLVLEDDVLLHPWTLTKYNKSRVWTTNDDDDPRQRVIADFSKGNICTRQGVCGSGIPQWIFPKTYAERTLQLLANFKGQLPGSLRRTCWESLVNLTKAEYRIFYGQSDIYYVPRRLSGKFCELANEYVIRKIYFEICIPSTLRCMDDASQLEVLPFAHVNTQTAWRDYAKAYSAATYFHPFKYSAALEADVERKRSLCSLVLPNFINHLSNASA